MAASLLIERRDGSSLLTLRRCRGTMRYFFPPPRLDNASRSSDNDREIKFSIGTRQLTSLFRSSSVPSSFVLRPPFNEFEMRIFFFLVRKNGQRGKQRIYKVSSRIKFIKSSLARARKTHVLDVFHFHGESTLARNQRPVNIPLLWTQ